MGDGPWDAMQEFDDNITQRAFDNLQVFVKGVDKDDVVLMAARASRLENQDAIDAAIVTILADPKQARAGITEIHFLPFNPTDKRTTLTYIDKAGTMHRVSKCAPEQEVPERNKDSFGGPWEFIALLPLFDPPRHDSVETIRRALELGVSDILHYGKSMENAMRACCKGIKIGKILIHRDGDNGKQVGYMDKLWNSADRDSLDYEIGVEKFLIFAEENCKDPKMIPCPCARCCNFKKFSVGDICEAAYNNRGNLGDDCDTDSEEFKRFLADAEQPLFEGSDSSKLDSMLKLHNWKARFGISDSAFTDLLFSVGSLLPKDHVLPSNAYTTKKTLSDFGLEYIKIHACLNECILYRGVNSDFVECPKCHISRWKLGKDGKVRVNVPAKIIWYFPIIPRFKRMFKSNSTAELLSWHANQRSQDG
ncbi:hypothetical protein AgCh_014439 [Apium graveolens]